METHTRPALRGQRVPPREDPRGQRRAVRRRLPEQSGLTFTHTSGNSKQAADIFFEERADELTGDPELVTRVRDKLRREPIEDLRIDFEDGYGDPGDDVEDAAA